MIPILVAIIAEAHERDRLEIIETLVRELKEPDVSVRIMAAELEAFMIEVRKLWRSPERLAMFPKRRLTPDAPAPSAVSELLSIAGPEQLIPRLRSRPDGMCVKAGLYLIHDYLDAAHNLAQEADDAGPNRTAPYWHGIMHRREPDYDNARFWVRQVGQHPVFPEIGREVSALLGQPKFAHALRCDRLVDRSGHWDPMAFIDLCEECGAVVNERSDAASRLQEIEMRLLLEYTCHAALEAAV